MKRLKKTVSKLFFLPPLLTLLISILSLTLVYIVLRNGTHGVIAYLSYVLSAYALVILVTGMPDLVRGVRDFVNGTISSHPLARKLRQHPMGERYFYDVFFRAEVSLYTGLFLNTVYVVLKLIAGLYYRSLWFVALAGYYLLLALMRFLLLGDTAKRGAKTAMEQEYRKYRLCGIVLLFMNQALAVIVILIVRQNHGYQYPGMLIYAMAAYSFYSIISAVIRLVKLSGQVSPVMMASKTISVVAAMISILSLETAMLAQFGGEDAAFRRSMTSATGGVVCTLVLGMAVFMIVKSTRKLKELKMNGAQAQV